MPNATEITKEEAAKIIFEFIRNQGFKGEIKWWSSYESRGRWCLEFFSPWGMFAVDANGKVEDNYNYFSAEKAGNHEPGCGCRYCTVEVHGHS